MKKWFILLLIIACASGLFAQNPEKSAFEKKFRTPGMARFKNENSIFANPDFKWKNYFYFTFFDIGYQSGPKNDLFVTDFFDVGGKYFRTKLFSAYSFDKPYLFKKEYRKISYWLPVGISFPLITGSKYNISLRCDYYWAIHFSDHSEYDDPENYTQKPSILDFQIQMDFFVKKAISKLNLVYGYRKQLTDWNVVESSIPVYSNDVTGSYLGISWGLGVSFKENQGLDDWETAKKVNTITSYESFLNKYPGSHYEKEGTARLEFAAYQTFEKGSIDDCMYYMSRFPSGFFLKEVQGRKEELVEENTYKYAVSSGKLLECDRYLSNYRNGKYSSEVEARKIEIYAKMKEDSIFNQTKNGGIAECNNYLAIYPSGEYVQMVKEIKEKLNQEIIEEANSYNRVVSRNDIAEMKQYLSAYPNGNHRAEVQKMIEPLLFNSAIETDWYTEYETYIEFCPEGLNIMKITQRLEFLQTHTAKLKADYPVNVKGRESPYSNVSSPFFEMNTTFRETGGEMGYKLDGSGWIYDRNGDKWGTNGYLINRGTVTVKRGGAGVDEYWCAGIDFRGGYAVFDWTGEDAGGHPLSIQVRINLQ